MKNIKIKSIIIIFALLLLTSCGVITEIEGVLNELTTTEMAPGYPSSDDPISSLSSEEPGSSIKGNVTTNVMPTPALLAMKQLEEKLLSGDTVEEPEHFPFALQAGTPVSIGNYAHPELGCSWMGIGGQVFGMDGNPIMNLVIEVGGELDNQSFFGLALTGMSPQFGVGGYEIKLSDHVLYSRSSVWVRVFSLEGIPLTPKIYFDTYNDCLRNLHLVNFSEIGEEYQNPLYLPIIPRR